MKYAILSDIHANPMALEAVLGDSRDCGVTKRICLGDVVGYGPDAPGAIRLVRENLDVCLLGNHDAAVAARISGADFSLSALQGIRRHRSETTVTDRQWLAGLDLVFSEGDMACTHGEFVTPQAFDYIHSAEDARRSLDVRAEKLLFVGHTHKSAVFALDFNGTFSEFAQPTEIKIEDGCRYLINVGSVGYPRYEPWSTYCIYDTGSKTLAVRRLPFDFCGYRRMMAREHVVLPSWFEDLGDGVRIRKGSKEPRTFWQMLKKLVCRGRGGENGNVL